MTASNSPYTAGDRVILITNILLLILLVVFVFALFHISNTYQGKEQEYNALVEALPEVPQITVKSAHPPVVEVPVAIITAHANKAESESSKAVEPRATSPAPVKNQPSKITTAVATAKPATSKPTINKKTRVARTIKFTDYLKLGPNGHILPHDATEWACVQDRVTGLIWEIKTDDNSMRDRDNFYTWYDPATERNHGEAGDRNGGRCKGKGDCDTHAYVQVINQQQLCGFSDWRLPSRDEMLTLIDYNDSGKGSRASINTDYFPQTVASWYWTASSNPDKPDYAWFVLFRNGLALNALKHQPKHVRLVRSRESEKKTLNHLAFNR